MNRRAVIDQIVECTRCELHEQCTLPVAFRGDPGPIAVVGEAPGETEDREGRPFIGPAGQLLDELLADAGITEPLAFVNTVSCFPHGTPTWDHMLSCENNKWTQLDYLNPRYVLLLGKVALKGMRPELELKRGRARPFLVRDRICFGTYHPAAALRNRNYEETLRNELVLFRQLLDAPDWRELVPGNCAACPIEAEWWEPDGLGWCRVHLPEAQVAGYEARQALLAAELDGARRRVTAPAEAADADWLSVAWDALLAHLRAHEEWHADDFWKDTTLERPAEARTFGPVVRRAAREGLMTKSGRVRNKRPIWTSKVYDQT